MNNIDPGIKRSVRKIQIFMLLWVLLEIGCYVGVAMLISAYYEFWALVGLVILGYILMPSQQKGVMSLMTSSRKLFATLLMIPTWLTKVIALFAVIPPIRRAVTALVMRRFVTQSMKNLFSPDAFSNNPAATKMYEDLMKNAQQSASRKTHSSHSLPVPGKAPDPFPPDN